MSSIARKRRRPNGGSSRKDFQHQKLIKSIDSFVKSIANFDLRLTKKFSVCAQSSSSFGNLRPLMKILEISCHFIPWFLVCLVLLTTVHKKSHVEILLNTLIGKCSFILLYITTNLPDEGHLICNGINIYPKQKQNKKHTQKHCNAVKNRLYFDIYHITHFTHARKLNYIYGISNRLFSK